jgi:hypothetical protein
MSEGVTLSSRTYKYPLRGFFCKSLLKSPAGRYSSPFTIQSLTKPPLITQLNTVVKTQQTAIIFAVLGYLV